MATPNEVNDCNADMVAVMMSANYILLQLSPSKDYTLISKNVLRKYHRSGSFRVMKLMQTFMVGNYHFEETKFMVKIHGSC